MREHQDSLLAKSACQALADSIAVDDAGTANDAVIAELAKVEVTAAVAVALPANLARSGAGAENVAAAACSVLSRVANLQPESAAHGTAWMRCKLTGSFRS